jgi:hypothetical protein
MKHKLMVLAIVMTVPAMAGALQVTVHADWASFGAAVGGAYTLAGLNSYPHLTNLYGVSLIPGLNVTSNMATVEAWSPQGGNVILAGFDDAVRAAGLAYYDINITLPYKAVAFDVMDWNPAAPGPAQAVISFVGGANVVQDYTQTGPTENTPVFFGITSDTPIEKIRWYEGPEVSGSGNEEVGLDNFAVSRIPEPLTISTLIMGSLFLLKRRRITA